MKTMSGCPNPIGVSFFSIPLGNRMTKLHAGLIDWIVGGRFIHMAPYVGPYSLEINFSRESKWVNRKALEKHPNYTFLRSVELPYTTNHTWEDFQDWQGLEADWRKMTLHYLTRGKLFPNSRDCFRTTREFLSPWLSLNETRSPEYWMEELVTKYGGD